MDFRFSEDSLLLASSVREYLTDTHGVDVLRRLDAEGPYDTAIWQGLVDMGLAGLLIPECDGGLGRSLPEAALIAVECGRACLAEPLVDVAFVTVPFLLAKGETGQIADYAAGRLAQPLAHQINPYVVQKADTPIASVDPLRQLAAAGGGASDDPHLLNLGALMAAAQLVGIAEAMLDQAVEYAKIRQQFGQPIGAFQAIKHQLANCAVAIEFARPVLWRAAGALDDGLASAPIHVSHAKLAAGDAAILTAETAHQVHGAMGYTYEVDLHFWMKRAWALQGYWGSRAFHYNRIDSAILGGSHPIGADASFA
ncbi:MAG: acyl-CoA/acyl-ACP dehydrogenase [Sphingomonadaceae bacterium]|nr:acyl-CoA/acyl-ACP dehydrogenase [Sphingomonadaceae bacterium]